MVVLHVHMPLKALTLKLCGPLLTASDGLDSSIHLRTSAFQHYVKGLLQTFYSRRPEG